MPVTIAETLPDFKFNSDATGLVKSSPVTTRAVVEHGVEDDDAHNVLIEVKAKLVDLSSSSVED